MPPANSRRNPHRATCIQLLPGYRPAAANSPEPENALAAKKTQSKRAHPVAGLFPLLEGDEFDALVEDIREHGLLEPIWLDSHGRVLDGRNRQRACRKAGVEPEYRTWEGEGSEIDFVVSQNIRRRHMDAGQLAAVSLDLLPAYEKEAKKRQGTRSDLDDNIPERFPEGGEARDHVAKLTGANPHYISDCKKIKEQDRDLFKQVRSGAKSIPEAKRELRQRDKAKRVEEIQSQTTGPVDSKGPFEVLYADPPWRYDHSPQGGDSRKVENHYPTMDLEAIKGLSVPAADDSVLFLWATSPKLVEALKVMEAWGFQYRTCMVWTKDRPGMGYYARQQHELLLIGKRGDLKAPDPEDRPSSLIEAPRGKHSEKPGEVYQLLERMYPLGTKVELFARNERDGWACWGNQV